MTVNVYLVNNSYSFRLAKDIIETINTNSRNVILPLGMTYVPKISSEIAEIVDFGMPASKKGIVFFLRDYLLSLRKIKWLESLSLEDQEINIYTPNFNQWVSNYCINKNGGFKVFQIAEGSLNYRERRTRTSTEYLFRTVFGIIAGYRYSFITDELEFKNTLAIYCYDRKHLVTNASIIHEIPRPVSEIFTVIEGRCLLLSQHLLFSLNSNLKQKVFRLIASELAKRGVQELIIKRHPSVIGEASIEESMFPSAKVFSDVTPAEELITDIAPQFVISVGGSSVFMDAGLKDSGVVNIAIGIDLLIDSGFGEFRNFKNLFSSQGVVIEG